MSTEHPLREERCPKCTKLLFRGRLPPGSRIEIKCPACRGRKPLIVIEIPKAA